MNGERERGASRQRDLHSALSGVKYRVRGGENGESQQKQDEIAGKERTRGGRNTGTKTITNKTRSTKRYLMISQDP